MKVKISKNELQRIYDLYSHAGYLPSETPSIVFEAEPVKEPKLMAPALVDFANDGFGLTQRLYLSKKDVVLEWPGAKRIIWPAPPRNEQGFYEVPEE